MEERRLAPPAGRPILAKLNSSAWICEPGRPYALSCERRLAIIAGGPADEDVDGGEVVVLGGEPLRRQEALPVARHDGDPEVLPLRVDRTDLVEEVRFGLVLDAVVEVDGRCVAVQASRHAQERRDADAARDPDLPVVRQVAARERAVRPLDDRRGAGLQRPQGTRVVADGLDRDSQPWLVGCRGNREGMELVAQERRKLLAEGLAEVGEEELPGRERERPVARLHDDLGHELVEPVHRGDAVLAAADEEAPEHRAVDERGDPQRSRGRPCRGSAPATRLAHRRW